VKNAIVVLAEVVLRLLDLQICKITQMEPRVEMVEMELQWILLEQMCTMQLVGVEVVHHLHMGIPARVVVQVWGQVVVMWVVLDRKDIILHLMEQRILGLVEAVAVCKDQMMVPPAPALTAW